MLRICYSPLILSFPFSELLRREAFSAGEDAVDRVQPGAGERLRVHHRLPGGEAGSEPEQQPESRGASHVTRHHQNGGGSFLLVRASRFLPLLSTLSLRGSMNGKRAQRALISTGNKTSLLDLSRSCFKPQIYDLRSSVSSLMS